MKLGQNQKLGENGGVKNVVNILVCHIESCHARVKTKHSSISNLYSLLKQHHPSEYKFVRPNKVKTASGSGTITDAFKLTIKFPTTSREHIRNYKKV